MKNFIKCFKLSCLFVGALVGAGMATGRELALFFYGKLFTAVIVSALFTSFFCFMFLETGRKCRNYPFSPVIKTAYKTLIAACSFVIYAAMLNSMEYMLFELWGIRYSAIPFCVFSLIITLAKKDYLKLLNTLIVPLMLILLVFVAVKGTCSLNVGGEMGVFKALLYASMNILFSGGMMLNEGKEYTRKQNVITSLISFVMITAILLLLMSLVTPYKDEVMPVVTNSIASGLENAAGVIILLAIVSTLTATNKLIVSNLCKSKKRELPTALSVAIIGLLSLMKGFEKTVNFFYPVISYLGVIFVAVMLAFTIFFHKNESNAFLPPAFRAKLPPRT